MTKMSAARKVEVMRSVTFEEGDATLVAQGGETVMLRITEPDARRAERDDLRLSIAAINDDLAGSEVIEAVLLELDQRDAKALTWDKKPRPHEISFYLSRDQIEVLIATLRGDESNYNIEHIVKAQLTEATGW